MLTTSEKSQLDQQGNLLLINLITDDKTPKLRERALGFPHPNKKL